MTPAVNFLKKQKISFKLHHYDHDPNVSSYGEEAADKLGVPHERLFKTLVVAVDGKNLMVAVVPVSAKLDLKFFAKAAKAKKTAMADKQLVERTTGYLTGGVSPLGQKKRLATIIDVSARNFETIFVSAGKRGLQMELSPDDLSGLLNAGFMEIAR